MHFIFNILLNVHIIALRWSFPTSGEPGERSLSHRRWPRIPATASYRPLPARERSLLELGDPYFEADEVLGKFAGCAHLHQFFYTWLILPSLSLRYLLRAFDGYGVKVVHINFLS